MRKTKHQADMQIISAAMGLNASLNTNKKPQKFCEQELCLLNFLLPRAE